MAIEMRSLVCLFVLVTLSWGLPSGPRSLHSFLPSSSQHDSLLIQGQWENFLLHAKVDLYNRMEVVFHHLGHSLFPRAAVLCLGSQLCPTLCDPMDCSPPGSSLYGILQARILELPCPPPGDPPNPRHKTRSPALRADSLPSEPPGEPYLLVVSHK